MGIQVSLMSGVAGLYNVPTTDAELATWAFNHQAHHQDIAAALAAKGVQMPMYILDPFDPNDMQGWLDNHQQLHFIQDAALGIEAYNLDSVEWSDVNQRSGWIFLNAQEHIQAADKLGIV